MRKFLTFIAMLFVVLFAFANEAAGKRFFSEDSLHKYKPKLGVVSEGDKGSLADPTISPSGPIFFCNGSSVTLTLNNVGSATNFQWKKGPVSGGGSFTDAGGSDNNSSYNVSSSGAYYCVVRTGSGAGSS